MRSLNRIVRMVAVLTLAVLLPVQAWAAVCAQVCAQAQPAAIMEGGEHEDCGKTQNAPGKCCMAHVVGMPYAGMPVAAAAPIVDPTEYVARWVSFIPEQSPPPPISFAAAR